MTMIVFAALTAVALAVTWGTVAVALRQSDQKQMAMEEAGRESRSWLTPTQYPHVVTAVLMPCCGLGDGSPAARAVNAEPWGTAARHEQAAVSPLPLLLRIPPPPLLVHNGSNRGGRCAWSQTVMCHASSRRMGHHRRSTLSNAALSIEQVVLTPATDERCRCHAAVLRARGRL
jgi:hypothetical protein